MFPEQLENWELTIENVAKLVNPGMTIAIIGSRDFINQRGAELGVKKLVQLLPTNILINSGGVRGTCRVAEQTAKQIGIPVKVYYPKSLRGNKLKHYEVCKLLEQRSQQLIDDSELIIVFRNNGISSGTDKEVTYCYEQNKRVVVFREKTKSVSVQQDLVLTGKPMY